LGKAKKGIFINAPMEKVNRYGRNPYTWPEWYSNFIGPDKMTGDGGVGTIMEAKYSVMGKQIPIIIEVVEDTLPVWKGKFSGSMEGEIIVKLSPNGDGTDAEIDWIYSFKKGVLGKIADMKVVERLLGHSLANTMENWKTICES
jgi:hypothetical protein